MYLISSGPKSEALRYSTLFINEAASLDAQPTVLLTLTVADKPSELSVTVTVALLSLPSSAYSEPSIFNHSFAGFPIFNTLNERFVMVCWVRSLVLISAFSNTFVALKSVGINPKDVSTINEGAKLYSVESPAASTMDLIVG